MEIRYYHLLKFSYCEVLKLLIKKTIARNWNASILVDDDIQANKINNELWANNKSTEFIPSGLANDDNPELQPILITIDGKNINKSKVLFIISEKNTDITDKYDDYELICRIFDGNKTDLINTTRKTWVKEKEKGLHLSYWQQLSNGSWQKKSSVNDE